MADSLEIDNETPLYEFVQQNSAIRQHTPSWFAARVIGGSSIGIFTGSNPYNTVQGYMSDKLGITKFESNVKMWFGTSMEPVIERWVERELRCMVVGNDIFVKPDDVFSYSPDGFAMVTGERLVELGAHIPPGVAINGRRPVLLEFKCPFSSIPKLGNEPRYYIDQVRMGLDMIDCVDYGLLINAVIRRCSYYDLNMIYIFDRTLVKPGAGRKPLAYGYTLLHTAADHPALADLPEVVSGVYDLGKCSPDVFSQVMGEFFAAGSSPAAEYFGPYTGPDYEIPSPRPGGACFVLPWKILKTYYRVIERSTVLTDELREFATLVCNTIRGGLELPLDEREKIVDEFYIPDGIEPETYVDANLL